MNKYHENDMIYLILKAVIHQKQKNKKNSKKMYYTRHNQKQTNKKEKGERENTNMRT